MGCNQEAFCLTSGIMTMIPKMRLLQHYKKITFLMSIYLSCIVNQRLLHQRLWVGGQSIMQQQISSICEGQMTVRGRDFDPHLPQALKGTTAVSLGPPEERCLIVDVPAGYLVLNKQYLLSVEIFEVIKMLLFFNGLCGICHVCIIFMSIMDTLQDQLIRR